MLIEAGGTVIFSLSDLKKEPQWIEGKYLSSTFIPDSIEPCKSVQILGPSDTPFKRGSIILLAPRVPLIKALPADPGKDLCQAPGTEDWVVNIGNEFYWLALLNGIERWIESLGS